MPKIIDQEKKEKFLKNNTIKFIDFSSALKKMKKGKFLTRWQWQRPGLKVSIQLPDEHSIMKRPYLYLTPENGDSIPWIPTHDDLLLTDWHE